MPSLPFIKLSFFLLITALLSANQANASAIPFSLANSILLFSDESAPSPLKKQNARSLDFAESASANAGSDSAGGWEVISNAPAAAAGVHRLLHYSAVLESSSA